MINILTASSKSAPSLKVSYKAANAESFSRNMADVVIVTDPGFVITSINRAGELYFGQPASFYVGSHLEDSIDFTFRHCCRETALAELLTSGMWRGQVIVRKGTKDEHIFNANCSLSYGIDGEVNSIVFVNQNITEEETNKQKLQSATNKYATVVESLSEGVIFINSKGAVIATNQQAADILLIPDDKLKGTSLFNSAWEAVRLDGSRFPSDEFPAIVSLRTGQEFNDVIMGLPGADGRMLWISINCRPIMKEGQEKPEGVVVSFKDISKEKQALDQLKASEQLFRSFMTNSPTLGWIYDEDGNLVYGNPLFLQHTAGDFDDENLPFSVAGPVKAKNILVQYNEILERGRSVVTEDEMILADGSRRFYVANWFLIPGNSKKLIGGQAVDITERKKLEAALLNEEVQKQRLISQATINAQEEERNRISGELHDNVNQLLISSRLHLGVAKNNPQNQKELLEKATEYLLMAVEEIRALSKKMNSHTIAAVGLYESVGDIVYNMNKLNDIVTTFNIDKQVVKKLSADQQLMIFRIIQEQSNNIIKHAKASNAHISLEERSSAIRLMITDDGKGFDWKTKTSKGIGLISIFNRVDAYNGHVDLTTCPGHGCVVDISFPIC